MGILLNSYKVQSQEKLYPNEFPLEDVTLLDELFKDARDLNIEVLLKYDIDRFLAPYRKEAGLKPKANPYPNWEGLDGHVGGHYLSAMAINYAATADKDCKERMDYMIVEIKACQEANAINNKEWGVGYAGGFPNSNSLWSAFKRGDFSVYNSSWAPFYNLHKMYAGLRDAWLYGDSEEAKTLFLKFCDWGIDISSGLTDEQMETMLHMEHGGMPEVFADAYQITGDEKYLIAAKRYAHKAFLEPLSEGIDILDNTHANTQIPKFVGFERIAELSNDDKYHRAGGFFWETVTNNRSLAFGGNSRKEHFPSKAASIDYINEDDGPESCNSYNMLKLTEDLFRGQPDAKYADYYERTLYNHILSTQHPEHGGYVYFTSARPRHYRVYSAPNEAMWCCVGTGMENHGKYNQFIYTHAKNSLYLNLFIASELNWKEKGIKLKQETNFPEEGQTKLIITEGKSNFNLLVRYPNWVKDGALKILVNGEHFNHTNKPSSYISVDRTWEKGDEVQIILPMHNTIEQVPNVPQYIAFLHGPILLGAETGVEDLKGIIADDSRFGQYPGGQRLPLNEAPILVEDDLLNIADKLEPIKDKPLHFKLNVDMENHIENHLKPFYKIHDSRYMMYWLSLTKSGYQSYTDSLGTLEKQKLELEKRTVDFVGTGEQQPESDHYMKHFKSTTGNSQDDFWRAAGDGGYFSYLMSTQNATNLELMVRYWAFYWGTKKFDIFIDDEKLVSVDTSNHSNISQFIETSYKIPEYMVKGKEKVRVRFQAQPNASTSEVYNIRLIKTAN
ncbi:glycoside hydrolase family 127 protein [Aestuariibaculum suncheonense]|uniref:Glycoside hydrolase family 127 protein n=2 Tax=Aestuariibaculum suncheonense TaxID=1028745 RepID=A0A8J6QDK3_9FLAO|nr:glycoside hydrolase family 127 protein [Aestuariibaculum suncheonense]